MTLHKNKYTCNDIFISLFICTDTCKNDGTSNDAEQYTCSNNYCIHRKLLCDDLSSANCGDGSDEKPGIPSNCSGKVSATFSIRFMVY